MPMDCDKNKRVVSIMPKDLAIQLKKLADKENRTMSNYIVYLVERELKNSNIRA